jgi:hypothetical protein
MLTVVAFIVAYGMGVGVCLAIHQKVLGSWEGVEFIVAAFWFVALPAMLMWWVVSSWIGRKDD